MHATSQSAGRLRFAFALVLGSTLGLALLKFGNPVILDRMIDPPQDWVEFVFQPWPVRWGYALLVVCAAVGVGAMRLSPKIPKWVLGSLLLWFVWQVLAAATTVDARLTQATLLQFAACAVCFFLGLYGLGSMNKWGAVWVPLLIGFGLVLWMGFEQHYGGLEATRRMFYEQPNWQQYPPDYLKKLQSNRIFSTLVYPNALAGAVLIMSPVLLLTTWRITARLSPISRGVLAGALAYGAAACLYWTGSRSGWLIAMLMLLVVILRQKLSDKLKLAIVALVLLAGLTGFFVKFAGYFKRGAPSVSARFEYWKAGLLTAAAHPVFGTGPGTFSVAYRRIKPPEAEMAQLAHNDYLEQASDSGLVGFICYCSFVLGSIVVLTKAPAFRNNVEYFAVWLGVAGWVAQSFVEFLLYIPALSWPAFAFLGWLWAGRAEQGAGGGERGAGGKERGAGGKERGAGGGEHGAGGGEHGAGDAEQRSRGAGRDSYS